MSCLEWSCKCAAIIHSPANRLEHLVSFRYFPVHEINKKKSSQHIYHRFCAISTFSPFRLVDLHGVVARHGWNDECRDEWDAK